MKYDQKQTETWINDIKQGNELAYREFYEYWYPRCFYIALAIMRNETDAKDAAQEAMLEVYKSIHNLRDIAYFKLWLNRIVSSKCNRIFRKKKEPTMSVYEDARLENLKEDRSYLLPDIANHRTTDCEVLQELIANISYKYREVLTLMYFEHMSIKEIAYCLQIPEGTVKSRLSSAKAKLKEEILIYEEQAGIPLNFKESTLEALLTTAFFNFVKQHKALHIESHSFSIKKPSMLTGKGMRMLLGCAGVVTGTTLLYAVYSPSQIEVKEPSTVQKQITLREFPSFTFKDIQITSAKDAYFVLKKYAHCDYDVQQLSDSEREKLENIENAMVDNSRIYAELYKK